MSYINYLKKINWQLFGKVCYYALVGGIVLIALLVIVSVLPLPGDHSLYVVRSGSMSPALEPGDLIFTKKTENYQENDIITFLPPDATNESESTTHRIVEIEEDDDTKLFTTKGDANSSPDNQQITVDRILGEYQFRIPIIGYPIGFAKTEVGLVVLIIIPAIVIIYDEIHKIREELKKKRKEKKDE